MTQKADQDHYVVLGISRDAPAEVVRAAFRVLVQKYHPDRNRSPGANQRAEEINTAYSVLKDPESRAEYDRQLSLRAGAPATEAASNANTDRASGRYKTSAQSIRRTVGRTVYELTSQDGVVHEHTEWTESIQTIKQDHRLFLGAQKRIVTESKPKQRLWLNLGGDDKLLERAGDWLPVAAGQPITLVSIYSPGRAQPADPLVLVNRATGRCFTLKTPAEAAAALLSPRESFKQMARLVSVFSASVAVLYLTLLRDAGILTWAVALPIGIPALFALATALTRQETRRLERDIRSALVVTGVD